MKKLIDLVLVVGFLVTDAIMFHDFFKVGEGYTPVEYAVGVLSVLVIVRSGWALFGKTD